MLKVPHYYSQRFVDLCFWCHNVRCARTHGLEMAEYRARLKLKARRALKMPLVARSKALPKDDIQVDLYVPPALAALLCLKPEQMDMTEHRLKGHYLRLRRELDPEDAWTAAKQIARKESKRSHHLYPRFSRQERANIQRYKPRQK